MNVLSANSSIKRQDSTFIAIIKDVINKIINDYNTFIYSFNTIHIIHSFDFNALGIKFIIYFNLILYLHSISKCNRVLCKICTQ